MGDDKTPPLEKSGASDRAGGPPSPAAGPPVLDEAAQRAELIARAKENTRRLQEQARISFETRRLRKEARRTAEEAAKGEAGAPPASSGIPAAESPPSPDPASQGADAPSMEPLDPAAEHEAMLAKARETTRRIQEQAKVSFETRRLRREAPKGDAGSPPPAGDVPWAPAEAPAELPPDPPVRRPRCGRKRVLVVDDARPVRQILTYLLQKAGYEVVDAASGGEAMIALRKWEIDLVILDVMMHPIDGYTVLHQIRETPEIKTLPVVLLTARNQREDILRAVREGANDFILKPFQNSALVAKIRNLLGDPVEMSGS